MRCSTNTCELVVLGICRRVGGEYWLICAYIALVPAFVVTGEKVVLWRLGRGQWKASCARMDIPEMLLTIGGRRGWWIVLTCPGPRLPTTSVVLLREVSTYQKVRTVA